MEDSNILGADAAIEANDRTKHATRVQGGRVAAAAAGSLRPIRADTFEDTPLLARADSGYGSHGGDGEDRRPRTPKDTEESSPFAHLPWYQRPSVRCAPHVRTELPVHRG